MRVALVHDGLVQFGGAEKLLLAISSIWPEAPLFTPLASSAWVKRCRQLGIKLQLSWMQHLPFKDKLERAYFFLYPSAFFSFDLSAYDVVISSSARFSHQVITSPHTIHICYSNTPGRMFWEVSDYFYHRPLLKSLLAPFLGKQRLLDWVASRQVSAFIANSKTSKRRLYRYAGRGSSVIYPCIDLTRFPPPGSGLCPKRGPFLIVSRLVPWKRVDLAVLVCTRRSLPLVVVGDGPDRLRLEKMAGPTVYFTGRLTDAQLRDYYKSCRAVIMTQKEDFGLVPLEAMASGRPVIAYEEGGAVETVLSGRTGLFFSQQTPKSLSDSFDRFEQASFKMQDCWQQAAVFSQEAFVQKLEDFVNSLWQNFKTA